MHKDGACEYVQHQIPIVLQHLLMQYQLSPPLARGVNEKAIPSLSKAKTSSGEHMRWHPAQAG